MNIYQLSFKSKIPISKLRTLERLGALVVDTDDDETQFLDGLIFYMRTNRVLSVVQLLALIEADLLDELEAVKPRYAKRARAQIEALGDTAANLAPREVTAAIQGASRHHEEDAQIIADWLKTVLPAAPVPHAWVAYRMLKPLNPAMREKANAEISLALVNARKLLARGEWWDTEKVYGRPVIKYFRPVMDF